jgi:two-component system response regulator HydG
METGLAGATILLVEDDDDAAFLFGMVLERAGAVVRRAAGVAEALEVAQQSPVVDLLVSDVHLPDGSGSQVLDGWPVDRARPVALALTGDTSDGTRSQLEAAGFHVVLAKPIAAEDVIRHGAELLARKLAGTAKASTR